MTDTAITIAGWAAAGVAWLFVGGIAWAAILGGRRMKTDEERAEEDAAQYRWVLETDFTRWLDRVAAAAAGGHLRAWAVARLGAGLPKDFTHNLHQWDNANLRDAIRALRRYHREAKEESRCGS